MAFGRPMEVHNATLTMSKPLTLQEVLSMSNASYTIRIEGTVLQQQLTSADAVAGVLTYNAEVSTIEIYNTDVVDGTFTANGVSIIVPAGGYFKATVEGAVASNEITVAGSTSYVINSYI